MCIICQGIPLEGETDIMVCDQVTLEAFRYPLPESLISLDFDSPLLTSLPPLPESLRNLVCFECIRLVSIPTLPISLRHLTCSTCPLLTALPSLPESLTRLVCYVCPLLTSLPSLPNSLKTLVCSECPRLLSLTPPDPGGGATPLPVSLRHFECIECASLEGIPPLPTSLTKFFVWDCRSLVYVPCKYRLSVLGCPWINDEYYHNRIEDLVKLQRFFKRTLFKRRLKRRASLRYFPREISNLILKMI